MSMHARQQILAAVIAALKAGVPLAKGRVDEDQDIEQPDAELPAILVIAGHEDVQLGLQVKERLMDLDIVAGASAKSGMQGALNALAAQVEATLDNGITVNGVFVPLQHQSVDADVSAALARKTGAVALRYRALYLTALGQPEQFR